MGLMLAVHNSVAVYPLSKFGNDEQKAKFLPPLAAGEKIGAFCLTEPNAGSDAMAIESTAIADGDSYVVNANKIFVTNGGVADTSIIFASVNPKDVKKGFTAILVERGTPGFELGLLENNCGMRANPVCSIVLTDCRVPKTNLLGQEGDGFNIAMAALDTGRVGISAQAVGIAQAALDVSLKYAKERIQFRVPLARHQAIQMMLADMGTMVEAARLLTLKAAHVRDQEGDLSCPSAMAKLFAGRTASQVASMGVQIHGGYGYSKDYPIERYFRDARATERQRVKARQHPHDPRWEQDAERFRKCVAAIRQRAEHDERNREREPAQNLDQRQPADDRDLVDEIGGIEDLRPCAAL